MNCFIPFWLLKIRTNLALYNCFSVLFAGFVVKGSNAKKAYIRRHFFFFLDLFSSMPVRAILSSLGNKRLHVVPPNDFGALCVRLIVDYTDNSDSSSLSPTANHRRQSQTHHSWTRGIQQDEFNL